MQPSLVGTVTQTSKPPSVPKTRTHYLLLDPEVNMQYICPWASTKSRGPGSVKTYEVENMSKTLKPGQNAPRSGQYEIVGPRGGDTGVERTVPRGRPLPPTPEPKQTYKLVDPTKNKSGRP